MYVPFSSAVASVASLCSWPRSNVAVRTLPSRNDFTVKCRLSAFTAFTPTPLRPTLFLNALESYLPPVLSTLTASMSLPWGMPRP